VEPICIDATLLLPKYLIPSLTLCMNLSPEIIVSTVTATKYSTIASLIFSFYDQILTFDAEVEFVWKRRWSLGKGLFILNRYFGLLAILVDVIVYFMNSLTDEFCKGFIWWEGVSSPIALLGGEIILACRVYAVYERSKSLLAVLGVLVLAYGASAVVIDYLGLHNVRHIIVSSAGCGTTDIPAWYFIVWIPGIVVESVLCLLMLYKAWWTYKEEARSPLLDILLRDNFLYFVTSLAVLLVNCLIWALRPQLFHDVALTWTIAVPCTMGSRLLLNMRERFFKEQMLSVVWSANSRLAIEMDFIRPAKHGTTASPDSSSLSMSSTAATNITR